MTDIGFIANSEAQNLRSEPQPFYGKEVRLPMRQGDSVCKCGAETVFRYCVTHNKWEWFEKIGLRIGGDHDVVWYPAIGNIGAGRPSNKMRATRGRGLYRIHKCPETQAIGESEKDD